jgi:steroid delta-isomerase-like uncharacterized protein
MASEVTTQAPDTSAAAPSEQVTLSRRLFEEAFNEGKVDLIDQYVAPGAVNHDPAEPAHMRGLTGPEASKRTVSLYRGAFPDLRIVIEDVIAADDKVVLRWRSEGTHRGELEGLAPTNARASVTGISIDRWENGKVVETWTEWDNLGLARQLGAAPPEGSMGEKLGMRMQRLTARRMRRRGAA